jgi:hypothetical protein
MSTYYNYVRRGTESQVDWGKIGKGLSDEIIRISQDREAKRTELDKLNTDLIRSASQVTAPEQEYVRNLVLNGTNEMKNLALTNNNLLKRGIITPAQYRMVMENMSAGVSDLDKASKEFDSSYKKSMERLAKGEMGFREQKLKENLFKYGNLKDKTLYVAPDGSMYITSIDDNGNPVADPRKMMNTGVLAQGLGQEITSFDLNANLEKGVNSIGSVVEVLRKNGVLTTESPMNNPKYKQARDLYIDSIMGDPNNVVDILGDFLGREDIAQDVNGNFMPTEQQTKEVREKITSMFDAMVSKKDVPMPIQQSSGGGGGGSALAKETELGNNVKRFLTGDGLDSKSAAQIIGSQNPNIRSLVKENGVIKISMNDGGYQEFDLNQEGANAEIIGRGLIGFALGNKISNVDQVLKRAGITPTLGLSLDPVYYEYQQGGKTDVLSKTQILSPDGKTIVFASNALNQIDPDADVDEDIQAVLSQIDPRLTVTTQSNLIGKDRLTLFLDGQEVNTIDYDDPKDRIELIKLIDQVRTQGAQGTTQKGGTTPVTGGQSR